MPSRAKRPEFAQRLRAALALRDATVSDLAKRVPPQYRLSRATIDRTLQGRRTPNEWEIPLFADLLAVPEWFLREGFEGAPAQVTPDDRDDRSAERHDELVRRLDELLENQRVMLARLGETAVRPT